jgi:glycosyltransferase involved in cell wall biosynthesis
VTRVAHVVPTDRITHLLLRKRLRHLVAAGYDVDVLCGAAPDSTAAPGGSEDRVDYKARLTDLGLGVRYLPFEREISPWTDGRCAVALYRALRDGGYDIVHSHNPKGGLLGPPVGQLARTPHVLHTVHGFLFHDNTSGLYHAAAVAAERWTATWSDHLLFQSEEDVEHARRHRFKRPERLHLVGNGVDETYFDPESARDGGRRRRAELGWNDDHIVVGIVGRVVEEKGYGEFFDMAGRLAQARDDVRFLVVGLFEPEQSDAVDPHELMQEHGLSERCHILQGRDDMPELYAAMDLFVLPSHREGLSRSILEAMAMARPIVTCDIRGCRELVVDGETGLLTPVRDAVALSAAAQRLVDDEGMRRRMGEASRARLLAGYTESVVAGRVADVYARLTEASVSSSG